MSNLSFKFGKHRGKPIDEVPASYLLWAFENIQNLDTQIKSHIMKNLRALEQEIEEDRDVDELDGLGFGPWEYWKD